MLGRFDFTGPTEHEQMPPDCPGCGQEPWNCLCEFDVEENEPDG